MNLSRAAKMFREQTPKRAVKPVEKKPEKQVEPPPAPVVAPIPQPVEVVEIVQPVAPPKKVWPEKVKRPRFVREMVEKREQVPVAAMPPRNTKFAAQLLTKNLYMPLTEESPKSGR